MVQQQDMPAKEWALAAEGAPDFARALLREAPAHKLLTVGWPCRVAWPGHAAGRGLQGLKLTQGRREHKHAGVALREPLRDPSASVNPS